MDSEHTHSGTLRLKDNASITLPVKPWVISLVFLAVSIITATLFTKYYFLFTHEYYPPAQSDRIADFSAAKVFQKRFLTPLFAKFIADLTDLSLDRSLKALTVVFCIGLCYGFLEFSRSSGIPNVPRFSAFLIFVPVSWNYVALNSIYHAYDLPTLCFYCWGCVFFLQKKYILFYLTFVAGTLNRESACFISITIALLSWNAPNRFRPSSIISNFFQNKKLFHHLFFQFILWLSITKTIEFFFKDNPGAFYEKTFSMIQFLKDSWDGKASWPYLDTSRFLSNPRCFFTIFLGIWMFVPLLWRFIPVSHKKLLLLIPIYLLPAILYANLMETRVYHELNVILAVVCISGFLGLKNGVHERNNNLKQTS